MYVVVHGGAGGPPDEPADRLSTLADAADTAADAEGPLDAVLAAVRPLERDPRFNAGVGGAVQSDGVVRTEAGLVTDDGTTGAACSMAGVAHAADVARVVATETPHVCLAGDPAIELAAASGIDTGEDLLTDRTRGRYEDADPPGDDVADHLAWVRDHFSGTDTVGAVATDGDRLAAATSTAGRWFALAGRVGDVPQIGAGFYADGRGGASATGEGEAIARFGLARRAVDLLETFGPRQAAEEALAEFERATDGQAGVVVLDHAGHVGSEYNTAAMQTSRAGPD
ncbi:isoaspartyl peptidase/L-asparaginase [Haloarcula pellucida]|uniref:Plant-type L-asparaginase n=1 Tax=Haloarcula pellucida TaxID=1427151 RepID=A0A830GKY2_9EURY|nr:isoaspartyl peptidase/L-asparaginase [Halomicroarcula pellucida]MBX0348486.1 isoaspartyl peptidase/L-asparaginase [Halomicroarcula pellucida]GGN93145.1 asparaginase [Halomicroarcula pellucida]